MKVILGLIAIIISSVLGYSYFKNSSTKDTASSAAVQPQPKAESEKYSVLSKELISEHKIATDCWLYIDDSVYVVTNFLQMHSGGPDKISPYCGADATGAFKSRVHSAGAKLFLKRLYLGKIDEKVLESEIDKVIKNNLLSPEE